MAKKNTNVVSKEYIALQQSFIDKQVAWRGRFSTAEVLLDNNIDCETPYILQGKFEFDSKLAYDFMIEILENLKTVSPDTSDDVNKVLAKLDEETVVCWIEQAIAMNIPFFEKAANDLDVALYLPHFVTENVVRPIIYNIAVKDKEIIEKVSPVGLCKCCGEPVRLSDLDNEGRKHIICPRCNTSWYTKKLTCARCNSENHKDMVVVKLEANDHEQIHFCKNCHNYTKVVSSKRLVDKVEPAMLDLLTIHLDFIAQEKVDNDEIFSS